MAENWISGAAEGDLDQAVLRRLITHVGAMPNQIYGGKGKQHLLQRLPGYNNAAKHSIWCVLIDLNGDAECAPTALRRWLPNVTTGICFRIAVRAIESWLLADRDRIAAALSVPVSRVPSDPETMANPKEMMIQIARYSRRRDIREDCVPTQGSGRKIGPGYTSRLRDFAIDSVNGWRPDVASKLSGSLERAIDCLRHKLKDPPSAGEPNDGN